MASFQNGAYKRLSFLCFLLLFYWNVSDAKLSDEKIKENMTSAESGGSKLSGGSAVLFADELKQTLEKYLFGVCPQTFKSRWSQMPIGARSRNNSTMTCDVDAEQHDLPGRLAALSLRAHAASRAECVRLGTALANTLGELARTAANRQASVNEANKKRKLSKSQKAKIQAKQRTALAVKKKAASVAAAAAAKIGTA